MPEVSDKRLLKVFLCHASQDKPMVRELSQRLFAEGWIDPWLDEKKLLPGQDWRTKIEEAVETSDIVIICLSNNSVSKEGFVQKELRYAREIALEKLDDSIFLIPLRLEDCTVPRGLRFYQWADYFGEKKEETYQALLESLNVRHEQKLKLEAEERARKEKAEKERMASEEKARREAQERARLEAEKRAQREREAREYKVPEAKARKEAEEKARQEAEERAHLEKAEKERKAAATAAQEKVKRGAIEETKHEKAENRAAQIVVLKENIVQSFASIKSNITKKTAAFISSQNALRWGLTALFLIALSLIIGLGSRLMPVIVSNSQVVEINSISNIILGMSESAPVLIVMDYEPSLAGEMEALTGPLLDQLVLLRHPALTFVSTSPNGSGLVDRLLTNTKISRPPPEGLGYQPDAQYINAGYLFGGLAGVRGFTESPQTVLPAVSVNLFSEFAAVILITDHAESGLEWIEQIRLAKQSNPALANQQLLVVASAQAGPMLRPYTSSKQVAGMPDAARYEFVNNSRPGLVRSYWDAFGAGLFLAILSIVIGSLRSLFAGIRERRAGAESV